MTFLNQLRTLIKKEFNQIRRDKRLALSLIVPPTLQLLLFGFALDADVSHLRLGIVDESRTAQSRELVASLTESRSFHAAASYLDPADMETAISRGSLDAGVVIPYHFARDLSRGRATQVQFILNAVNANTAAIAQGYAEGVVQSFNSSLTTRRVSPSGMAVARTAFLFNPGLVNAWFIVTGTFGVLLILNGSLVASTAMIKEREAGTVEQLLITPANTTAIIVAKMTPLFFFLMIMVLLAITLMRVVFGVPVRGSMLLVIAGAALCVLCGIGLGTFIATFSRSAQQSQLMSFFVNPPFAVLSGALTPVEAMPGWLQPVTIVNPIRHFGVITRSVLLKGSGIDVLWVNFAALTLFTVLMIALSVWRFRKQLS